MIQLIINADDLGLHPQIDQGIFKAHTEGIVTSASLLVTAPNTAIAVRQANQIQLALGLHFCLTNHLPPAAPPKDIRWLAPGGRFRGSWAELSTAWLMQLIPADEVVIELRAQIARAKELGAQIDHLDTHQHLHLLPGISKIVDEVARELRLPVRWPLENPGIEWLAHPRSAIKSSILGSLARLTPPGRAQRVRAYGVFESGRLTEKALLRLLRQLPDGPSEIVTHPGENPAIVESDPSWRYDWEKELKTLTSPGVAAEIDRLGISLTTYGAIAQPHAIAPTVVEVTT